MRIGAILSAMGRLSRFPSFTHRTRWRAMKPPTRLTHLATGSATFAADAWLIASPTSLDPEPDLDCDEGDEERQQEDRFPAPCPGGADR
jgi:hypothetical protein